MGLWVMSPACYPDYTTALTWAPGGSVDKTFAIRLKLISRIMKEKREKFASASWTMTPRDGRVEMCGTKKFVLLAALLALTSSLAGCTSDNDTHSDITVDLKIGMTNTTWELQRAGGTVISNESGEIWFDLSRSESKNSGISKFRFDFGDGSEIIEGENGNISHEFEGHGLFLVIMTVFDGTGEEGHAKSMVRIEHKVRQSDSSNGNPPNIIVYTGSKHSQKKPERIHIESEVTNTEQGTSVISLGGPIDVTWTLNDNDGNKLGQKSATIDDGNTAVVTFDQDGESGILGEWLLIIEIDGQNDQNIQASTTGLVEYPHLEYTET